MFFNIINSLINFCFFLKLQEISSKLGPILNLGELVATQPKQKSTLEQSSTNVGGGVESSQKYTNISEDATSQSYNRELTVASVSKVGLAGDNMSRPSTSVSTRPESSVAGDMKSNFDS